jgi:hypothetical protein
MADKILLCISATQAVAAHQRGRSLTRCEIFSANEEGLAAFDAFLDGAGTALVYAAVDSVEEDYRFETLPHATGSDRAGMLDRKLKQYYRNSPYATAIARGRVGDKRRDDRYLFAALTNPALIDPWLAAIARRGLPVAGIYLASMLAAPLVRKTGHDLSHVLVAAPHGAGLRLTFFKDGEFCVSRLSRGATGAAPDGDMARAFATEISNTRLYLSSLHLDTLDEPLKVLLLDRDDSLGAVAERLSSETSNIECVRVGRDTLARQLHIAPEHLDIALESAYLALLAEKAPDVNIAPASVTSGYRQHQRRIAIHAASALAGAAGVLWAAHNLWLAHDLREQTAQAARRTTEAQAQYRELTREFPATPTTSENLVNAVEIYKKVSKTVRSPLPYMQIVSRAVATTPEVFLQEINWTFGTETVSVDGAPRTPQPGAAPEAAGTLRQSGYVTGEIRPFQGDYRAAIDAINAFAKQLAANPAVADVRVVKYPLNVNPGLALAGNTRDAAEHAGIADFKIVLTLKPDA